MNLKMRSKSDANTKTALQNALFLLQRNNLEYTIYGQGEFFFAFWLPDSTTTYFVKHATIVEYTLSIQEYIEKEKQGKCQLLIFDESGNVTDLGGGRREHAQLPTILGITRHSDLQE